MYGDLIEELRDGLAVSAEYDSRIARGLTKAARQLLMTYNFREAVRRATLPIAAAAQTVALPADAGKVKAVRLVVVEGGTTLYKRLKRREAGILPRYNGPEEYFTEGGLVWLDQPLPPSAVGYNAEIWYQSNDPALNETWLSTVYEAPLEHLAGVTLALKMRKQEAATFYGSLWQQDTVILARYVAELEFGDMDMSMGETGGDLALERYPAA